MIYNYVPLPVLGGLSRFVFLFLPVRVLFLMPLTLFYNHTYPKLIIIHIREEQGEMNLPSCPDKKSQYNIFFKILSA